MHLSKVKFNCIILEKIRHLFYCNMIINNILYSTMVKEDENDNIYKKINNLKDFKYIRIDIGIDDYNLITIYKINSKFYDYKTSLRKYIPYLIRWNTNNDY